MTTKPEELHSAEDKQEHPSIKATWKGDVLEVESYGIGSGGADVDDNSEALLAALEDVIVSIRTRG